MLNVYIANLGKYNEGELVGEWLELPASQKTVDEVLTRIGIGDEYEEYAIHDYECDIEGVKIAEFENLDNLNDLAARLEAVTDQEAFEAILGEYGDLEQSLDTYESENYSYYSGIANHEDLGYYIVEEGLWCENVPDSLRNYLDYEAIDRDYDYDSAGGFYGNGYLEIY